MKQPYLLLLFLLITYAVTAQREPDRIYMEGIQTVKLFQQNDQQSVPLIRLGTSDLLELHFDDLSGTVKNFFYT
ncbi:DUF5103 domain-containing protein, partial [Salmonella enterica subsp. enterica serovar Typhimurium]|nr:DUF5103 domain-containing protein [Salmonella enterica subsp. enterica serovar Typhimurium]